MRDPCLGTSDGYTTSAPAQRTTPVGSAHKGDTASRTVLQRIARTRSHAARSQPGTTEGNRRSSRSGSSRQSSLAPAVASRTHKVRSLERRVPPQAVRGATTRTVAAAVTHSAHAAVPYGRPATSIRQVATDSRSPTYRHKPCTLGRSPGGLLPKLCPAVAQREKSLRRSLGGLLPKSCPAVAQREIRQRSLGGPNELTKT